MSIYIDEEFDAYTLEDLKHQVVERAEYVWYQEIESEVDRNYHDMRVQVFGPRPETFGYSTTITAGELWSSQVVKELAKRSPLMDMKNKMTERMKGDDE